MSEEIFTQMGGVDGVYTFVWVWAFSSETNYYTTCWEANVTSDGTIITITDNTNGNTGDSDGNTDEESEEEEVEQEYQFTIPVCYSGTSLDTTLLMNAFTNLANKNAFNDEISFSLLTSMSNNLGNIWNASIESNYMNEELYVLLFRFIDNGTLCEYISNEFNNIGTCSICGGASAHANPIETNDDSNNNNNNNNNTDGAVTILIIAIVCVILLLLALFGYYFYTKKKNDKINANGGVVTAHAPPPMATHINANQGNNRQSNIISADDAISNNDSHSGRSGPPPTQYGARPSGRPPKPPPPRPTNSYA